MPVSHSPLPSGAPMHIGSLVQRKQLTAKTRRSVIVACPRSTKDLKVIHDLLASHRAQRNAQKNREAGNSADRLVHGAVGPAGKKEDYELLGHLTHAALTGCPLMIVGTTTPTFIHFSNVGAILDERESGTACNFVVVEDHKEHRFAADMSTDYTEWIYALRDAMTIGNRHSYRGSEVSLEDALPTDHTAKRSQSLLNKSPSTTNLGKRFGFPNRSHTLDSVQPPVVYNVPSDNDDDDEAPLDHVRHSLRSDSIPEELTSNNAIAPPAVTAYENNAEPVPPSLARKRSDANVRFSDRPHSVIIPDATDDVPEVGPPTPAKDSDDTATEGDEEDEEAHMTAAAAAAEPSALPIPQARPAGPRPNRIGGMVGEVPQMGSTDSASRQPINRTLSRKISSMFGGGNASSGELASQKIDAAEVSGGARGSKSIGRKFSNLFTATATNEGRGRGRTKVATRDASSSTLLDDEQREPRSRSLVRMFSRTTGTSTATKTADEAGADDERAPRSRSKSNTRSRSTSRTRLFTLVPSVRYTGSASLGNMFRRHTGDPEIDDTDDAAPAAAQFEDDEELPRRRGRAL